MVFLCKGNGPPGRECNTPRQVGPEGSDPSGPAGNTPDRRESTHTGQIGADIRPHTLPVTALSRDGDGRALPSRIRAAGRAGEGAVFRGFLERRLPGRDRRISAEWAGIGRATPGSGDDTGVFNPIHPPHQRGAFSTSTTIL